MINDANIRSISYSNNSSLSFKCAIRRLCRRKKGDGRLIYFFDIWALPKCQKNKSSVQKNLFAADGGYLAMKKITEVLFIGQGNF